MRMPRAEGGGLPPSLLSTAAILLLIGGLYTYHQETHRLSEQAQTLEESAEARALRMRLLGMRLDDRILTALDRSSPARAGGASRLRILWFVNPGTCVSCLDDLSHWRALNDRSAVRATVILTGIDRRRATEVEGAANFGGEVLWGGAHGFTDSLIAGDSPPFLLLVVGQGGEVLAAEVGDRRTTCGPNVFRALTHLVEAILEDPGSADGPAASLASRKVHESVKSNSGGMR